MVGTCSGDAAGQDAAAGGAGALDEQGDLPSIDFYAARDIPAGQELTFDYGLAYWVDRGVTPVGDTRGVQLGLMRAMRLVEAALPALKAAR